MSGPEAKASPQDRPPRKVLVGSVCRQFNGAPERRAALVEEAVAELAGLAERRYGGRRLDLVVLPEHCLGRPGRAAAEKTVPVDFVKKVVGGAARRHGCYVAAGVFLMSAGTCRMPLEAARDVGGPAVGHPAALTRRSIFTPGYGIISANAN